MIPTQQKSTVSQVIPGEVWTKWIVFVLAEQKISVPLLTARSLSISFNKVHYLLT